MSRFVEIMQQIATQDLPSNQLYDVADDLVAGADALLAEVQRLRVIESAARGFATEADDSPRYIQVRTWATPAADPYLKFRAALKELSQPKI